MTQLVPRRRRGGRVPDRQCVAWASGGVGAERRAACDAACESLGTWIWDLRSRRLERGTWKCTAVVVVYT